MHRPPRAKRAMNNALRIFPVTPSLLDIAKVGT
jgi:hypothetical protein